MNQRNTILWAAVIGCTAVVIGAFGAHAFKPALIAAGRLETYELAVRYQFYHGLAMLGVGVLMNQFPSKFLKLGAVFFLVGIFFFSGSLYALCFTGLTFLGAVTPFGGVLFIAGWVMLFWGVYKR
ncbi:MAG: DUF423 domain-containing protein [Marivirga sp.]|nr:DUF423 domain-containing protein [Marivirga sp.]